MDDERRIDCAKRRFILFKLYSFITVNGIINYNGQKWTEDNRALFALYYLATSCGVLNQFVDGEKYAYSDLTRVPPWLKPTFPPTDPRFKLKDAENALKDLGISIDGQSHVD